MSGDAVDAIEGAGGYPATTMTVDQRQRFIRAAQRGLAWRRDKIMIARLTFSWACEVMSGKQPDWHSLFECDRHGHHPLSGAGAKWVGPYDFTDTIDTSSRFAAPSTPNPEPHDE